MFRVLLVACWLLCVIPLILGQSSSQQIIYTHYENSRCDSDGTQAYHVWSENHCVREQLLPTGPYQYVNSTIVNNSTVAICVSNVDCSTNSTCTTYPTNQCLWDLTGTSWSLSITSGSRTPVPTVGPTNTPTSSPSETIVFTHYNNRWCYDDNWAVSHIWSLGTCLMDYLALDGNYTSIKATLAWDCSEQVELCTYSNANTNCELNLHPQCNHYILNTCYPTSNTTAIRVTTGATPTPTPTPTPTSTPGSSTQPPPILGKTIVYDTFTDRYCGMMAQPAKNWDDSSCVLEYFDWYSNINIMPHIVSSSLVELCIHSGNTSPCNGNFSLCRIYRTDTCIVNPSGAGSFRVQIYGANLVPTLPPTPTPTPNPNEPVILYTHYDDYACRRVSPGYPHAWYQQTLQYEHFAGQVVRFNSTVISSNLAYVCVVQFSVTDCQYVAVDACLPGPSGQFMLQVVAANSSLIPTTPPTYPPTPRPTPTPRPGPHPIGITNIIYTRYKDPNCETIDPLWPSKAFINGQCDTYTFFNGLVANILANVLADGSSVQVCESFSACYDASMTCRTSTIGECQSDWSGYSFRYTLSRPVPSSSSSRLSTGVLLGVIAGGVAALVILVGIMCYCRTRPQQLKQQEFHAQQDGRYTRV